MRLTFAGSKDYDVEIFRRIPQIISSQLFNINYFNHLTKYKWNESELVISLLLKCQTDPLCQVSTPIPIACILFSACFNFPHSTATIHNYKIYSSFCQNINSVKEGILMDLFIDVSYPPMSKTISSTQQVLNNCLHNKCINKHQCTDQLLREFYKADQKG